MKNIKQTYKIWVFFSNATGDRYIVTASTDQSAYDTLLRSFVEAELSEEDVIELDIEMELEINWYDGGITHLHA